MPNIDVLDRPVIYENPTPSFYARHGYFPGGVTLISGEILVMFRMAQAFEAPDGIVCLTRSVDGGKSWSDPVPYHDRQHRGLGSMKPTRLDDGRLVAIGYNQHPDEQGRWINQETGSCPPGKNLLSFSEDDGRTWSRPRQLRHRYPEMLETSGPCIPLACGDLLALGTPGPLYDGSRPTGVIGLALRSGDGGRTWDDRTVYFDQAPISPMEARLCQMPGGRVVALVWALDETAGVCHPNLAIVSHDDGRTWSDPIDTGIAAQASYVCALKDNLLLSIHAHRETDPVGLFVRIVDFADEKWNVLAEARIFEPASARKVGNYLDMAHIKFGQPSLIRTGPGNYLACFWSIEEGEGRIRGVRLRIEA